MSPIYPVIIPATKVVDSAWVAEKQYVDIVLHIKNLCADYPSILIGYSSDFEAKVHSNFIAETITEWGINVFMPEYPVPLAALSYALTTKAMPIGLYIEEDCDNSVRLIPISSHGGLFDEQDLKTSFIKENTKKGVIGSTDLSSIYIKHLAGFADPYIEKGLSFSNIEIPFKEILKKMELNENLSILFERDGKGPSAHLSSNGCLLKITENNSEVSTKDMAKRLAKFMKEERYSSGTLLVPSGSKSEFESFGEIVEVEGGSYDLSYSAAFSDLFLGWWPDGMIAMQGSSCFGDGILAAIYYLESLRSIK